MNTEPLSAEELQALREALGEAPVSRPDDPLRQELCKDFAKLNAVFRYTPSSSGADDDLPVPPMPAHVLARLQAGGDAAWKERQDAQQRGGFTVVPKIEATTRAQPTGSRQRGGSTPKWLAMAAALVVLGLVASLLFKGGDPTQPTFAWNDASSPNQKYDVWVLPPEGDAENAPVLFVKKDVRSPVKLADMKPGPKQPQDAALKLEKDKPYRLLVCLATVGKFGGDAIPFNPQGKVTVPAPTAPAVLKRLIDTGRTSDAQKVLKALPEAVLADPAVKELEQKMQTR